MTYLVLHFDTEFVVGSICADNKNSYPTTNDEDGLQWLYFFTDPHRNLVSFGKGNKAHYNKQEINYFGNLFELIENEQETFIIRGIQKKAIELLNYSGLLEIFKVKYKCVTLEDTPSIPTLITFSLSISELAKLNTVNYLKTQGFQIDSFTIPLAELTCYYPFSKQKFTPANGDSVLLLSATNATLHLMKLVFSDNYFMIDGERQTVKGKGIDPRKRSLVKYVVDEVNKHVGALKTEDEKEEEYARKEEKADDWLREIDNQQFNRPIFVYESVSKMPDAKREIQIWKANIESDTGHYIQELMDVFESFKNDNTTGDVAAVFLLGDCFQNSLVRGRFEKLISSERLYIFTNKDIQQILSVYPAIDFKRYIDQEARIKALAHAEAQKQAEQRALEDHKRKEETIEAQKVAEKKQAEKNRIEAEQLHKRATELESDGKFEDARVNAEKALDLDRTNRIYKQLVLDLNDRIEQQRAKNELYKSYLNKADKFLENSKLDQALEEYEAAQSIFDNAEITKKIVEVKRLIKNLEKTQAAMSQLLADAKSLKEQEDYLSAKEKVNEILSINKDHSEAKILLTKIEKTLQKQVKQQQEEENKIKCEENLVTGNNLFDRNNWAEAQLQYEVALKLCPQEKSINDKIKLCADKIKMQEDTFNDLIFEVTIAESKGNFKEALNCLEKAISLKSDDKLLARVKILKNIIKVDFGEPKKTKINNSKDCTGFLNTESICKKETPEAFITPPQKIITADDFLGVSKSKRDELENTKNDFDNW